jgi:hypothetical protein
MSICFRNAGPPRAQSQPLCSRNVCTVTLAALQRSYPNPRECGGGAMSPFGTSRTFRNARPMSAIAGKADNICSFRALPLMSRSGGGPMHGDGQAHYEIGPPRLPRGIVEGPFRRARARSGQSHKEDRRCETARFLARPTAIGRGHVGTGCQNSLKSQLLGGRNWSSAAPSRSMTPHCSSAPCFWQA